MKTEKKKKFLTNTNGTGKMSKLSQKKAVAIRKKQ